MSTLTILLLTCDGLIDREVCPEEYGGDLEVRSIETLRERAAGEGWRSGDDRDYCPSTHDARKEG